jgi:hypothetical protein
MNSITLAHRIGWLHLVAVAGIAACPGCTSVISSAYLRETWLDAVEHATEVKAAAKAKAAGIADEADADGEVAEIADEGPAGGAGAEPSRAEPTAAPRFASLDEALDDADRRLTPVGGLDSATRTMLISTLAGMPKQDWPVVIEEFTAALAVSRPAAPVRSADSAAADPLPPADVAGADEPAAIEQAVASPVPQAVAAPAMEPAVAPLPASSSSDTGTQPGGGEPQAAAPANTLSVQNACFVSRVRGWGAVDRFETSRFHRGQEVIVYFELDHLKSRESAAGNTTRIDTVLRLVGDDGRRVHEWTFEPLEETCRSVRRDYFARYLLSVPDAAPVGACRLELLVSDAVAGRTAQASLPLEVEAVPAVAR